MSFLNLKWTKGAPERLLPGMVIRVGSRKVALIGSYASESEQAGLLAQTTAYAQAISSYELEWLESDGIPAKAVS